MELAVLTNLNFVRNSEPTEKFVQVPTRKSLQVMGKSESNLIELVAQQGAKTTFYKFLFTTLF